MVKPLPPGAPHIQQHLTSGSCLGALSRHASIGLRIRLSSLRLSALAGAATIDFDDCCVCLGRKLNRSQIDLPTRSRERNYLLARVVRSRRAAACAFLKSTLPRGRGKKCLASTAQWWFANFVLISRDPPQHSNLRLASPTTAEEYCRERYERAKDEEKRRRKASGPSRIRQMGERSPKRRQEDGRVRFLRTLRERKARPSDFRAADSKWQIVHLWLRHGGRLKD